jgi:hypothetical protein
MGRFAHVVAIAALVANSGCLVVSISPLSTEKDAVFEPALVGSWNASPTEQYLFSKLGENAYKVEANDGKTKTTFVGHLVRLDGVLFLDMAASTAWAELGVPKAAEGTLNDWFLPLHFFVRVNQVTPSFSVSAVDETWFKGYLKEHPTALAYTFHDSDVVLTGSTDDIQKFFRAHANTPGAFEQPTVLTRQAGTTEGADISGTYALVSINGNKLPFSHPEGAVIRSGVFTINKDGTCSSKMTFSMPSGDDGSREVSATYTREGSKLTMTWTGAGTTTGSVEGNTFKMNNEGMVFAYRK